MVPLFFVVLGARLDLRALWHQPSLLVLAALLAALNAAVHLLAAVFTRQQLGAGLAATAQLGVPAAVVTLGLENHVLTDGEGSAIVTAALVSLALTAAGVTMLARRQAAATAAAT
jgi:Kef-type K+ transport system membrane component KefB